MESREIETGASEKIIVGLGNPGNQYAANRHNIGFMVLDLLAMEANGQWTFNMLTRTCHINIDGNPVLLVEPLNYMNNSGKAVHTLLSALQRGPEGLLVICDDLNLPLGRIRIREKGSAGGHHGLESILSVFGTEEISRLRVGIGEEQMPEDKAGFVLSDFPPGKKVELSEMICTARDAVKSIVRNGVPKTMAIFNA
jgi:peptidyl-tRNA hydrolase, PTH1 family